MSSKSTPPITRYAIEVSVRTQYLAQESKPIDEVYAFSYTITVSNVGNIAAQLISRHWHITDEDNQVEEVKGLGVVGHQPYLKPSEAFEYTSGCRLRTPTGNMRGVYHFVAEDTEGFEVDIPRFLLDATGEGRTNTRALQSGKLAGEMPDDEANNPFN